jgi:hypothetical protein
MMDDDSAWIWAQIDYLESPPALAEVWDSYEMGERDG